jgi:type IX secretion system PorP/SprF family membrane protein
VIKPSVMVKYVDKAPAIADFNVNVLLSNILWLGVGYRTNDAVVGMVELQLSKKLRIGYSYDYTLSDIQQYSSGSHEFMLGYDFGYDIMKMKTPRYF